MAYALRDVEPANLHRLWPVVSPDILPTGQRKLARAEARVSQVEAELRLILVEEQVSNLRRAYPNLSQSLLTRTERDILMRPSNWASPGRTAP
jgi:hypothetical protein